MLRLWHDESKSVGTIGKRAAQQELASMARVVPGRSLVAQLAGGIANADFWVTDTHKWLNVPTIAAWLSSAIRIHSPP
jgi:hypothetical protein